MLIILKITQEFLWSNYESFLLEKENITDTKFFKIAFFSERENAKEGKSVKMTS